MKKTPFALQVRHYTALISAFIYNLKVFGLSARNVCAPGFNCHGCPWATFSCPVGIIGYGFGVRAIPAFALGAILATGLVLGRLVCGYACPVGLAQELVYQFPGRKFKIPPFLRYFKYIILFFTVFFLTWFFGFQPENAYLQVNKPEISKYPPTPAKPATGFGALSNLGGFSNPGALGAPPATPSTSIKSEKNLPEPQPFHQSITQKNNLLKVEIEVENISGEPLTGFELSAAFYAENGKLVWQAPENRKFDIILAPGERYTVEPFTVPNLLSSGGLVVTSPQSKVSLDYWPLFCTYCPVAAFEADLPAKLTSAADLEQMFYQTTKMNLPRLLAALFITIACVMVSRFFCRVVCPLGAMYALFARFSFLRIEVDQTRCTGCGLCNAVCPVELNVTTEAGGAECIACGNCVGRCPTSAISRRFSLK